MHMCARGGQRTIFTAVIQVLFNFFFGGGQGLSFAGSLLIHLVGLAGEPEGPA